VRNFQLIYILTHNSNHRLQSLLIITFIKKSCRLRKHRSIDLLPLVRQSRVTPGGLLTPIIRIPPATVQINVAIIVVLHFCEFGNLQPCLNLPNQEMMTSNLWTTLARSCKELVIGNRMTKSLRASSGKLLLIIQGKHKRIGAAVCR